MARIYKDTGRYELDKKLDHYNWENGLDFPNQVVNHPNCELGTALKAFYLAGGELYLRHITEESGLPDGWLEFMGSLYDRVVSGLYTGRFVGFTVPLSKTKRYLLLKAFPDTPDVFINNIAGSKTDERCEQCFVFGLSERLAVCKECKSRSLRIDVDGSTYSVHCDNCGFGLAATCIRPCLVNDTTPKEEFTKYDRCEFRV